MKLVCWGALVCFLLTGCSRFNANKVMGLNTGNAKDSDASYVSQILSSHDTHYSIATTSDGETILTRLTSPSEMSKEQSSKLKLIDYVTLMAAQLVNSSHYINSETAIGVASFVPLDDYKQTNAFGLQLAESFVFEMQQKGLSVIDYKSTGFIRITSEGDFVYSRNIDELSKRLAIEYLLLGTFSETKDGIIVNTRIVGAQSKVVVASAQQLIPINVYKSAVGLKTQRRDGILTIGSLE